MKFVLAIFAAVLLLQVVTAEKKTFKEIYEKCLKETHVNEDVIKKMRKNIFEDLPEQETYVDCMFQKLHFMDEDRHIKVQNILDRMPDTVDKVKAKKNIEKCWESHKDDSKNERSYKVYRCYKHEDPAPIKL